MGSEHKSLEELLGQHSLDVDVSTASAIGHAARLELSASRALGSHPRHVVQSLVTVLALLVYTPWLVGTLRVLWP